MLGEQETVMAAESRKNSRRTARMPATKFGHLQKRLRQLPKKGRMKTKKKG